MAKDHAALAIEPAVLAELRKLVERAQGGDRTALSGIRTILDDHPELWHHLGDLSARAEGAWIEVLAAHHPLVAESLKRSLVEMKADLAGDKPTALERMLVDQIISCWLEVKCLESISADPGEGSLQQAGHRLRRLESAQKRHLKAVQTLVTLRALLPSGLVPRRSLKLYDGDSLPA
jgi:hypothetical protein